MSFCFATSFILYWCICVSPSDSDVCSSVEVHSLSSFSLPMGCFIQQGKERQKDTMSAFCPSNIQKVTLYPSDTSLSLSFVCPFLSRLYSKVHWIGKIRGFCVSTKKKQQRFYMKSYTHNLYTLFLLSLWKWSIGFIISRNHLLLVICHRKWSFNWFGIRCRI